MILGATFHDHRMALSGHLCKASMLANGVTDIIDVDSMHVTSERGAGYWRWMPEVVVKGIVAARHLGFEFFVYSDAGVEFTQSIRHITDRMALTDHVWLFGNEHSHEQWCKADVLRALKWEGTAAERQVQASVHVWRSSSEAIAIAKEWESACDPKWMIDDSPSSVPNHPEFKEHRHTQSTLTCVAYRHILPLHWWPAQYGVFIKHRYPNDKYPVLFNHHGRRDPHAGDGRQTWGETQYQLAMAKYP